MYCAYCGKQIQDNNNFCPYCGKEKADNSGYLFSNEKTIIFFLHGMWG